MLAMAAVLIMASGCSAQSKTQNENTMKSVIFYFSCSGNTERAAKELGRVVDAPVIRLEPVEPYTAADLDWEADNARCNSEHKDPASRPALRPVDFDFASVDTVFVGFPIWWYMEPRIINTFFDNYDTQLKGKAIYPFCTSGESPVTDADKSLKKGYPNLDIKAGLRFPASKEEILRWIGK